MRIWFAKLRFLFRLRIPRASFSTWHIRYGEYQPSQLRPESTLEPYQGLSHHWHEYSQGYRLDYSILLKAFARRRKLEVRTILDLACGTGSQTLELAKITNAITGVDISENMLTQARANCSKYGDIQFSLGDFRNFELNRCFDAVVCASNSLNYAFTFEDMDAVFQSVSKHLKPGGLFLFDTITERGNRAINGIHTHAETSQGRFVVNFRYDDRRKIEESISYTPMGIEVHRRKPIDPDDVMHHASLAGFEVLDYFSSPWLPGWLSVGITCYFVLVKK